MKLGHELTSVKSVRCRARPVKLAVALCIIASGAWVGHAVWDSLQGRLTPSCSWPLRIQGSATAEQAGLVRCYLRALATNDASGLMAVAPNIPDVRITITKADFAHSADARAGLATATFTPSPVDDTFVLLTVTYANGASERTGIENMVAIGGGNFWRMPIGTEVSPGPSVPPATRESLSPSPRSTHTGN